MNGTKFSYIGQKRPNVCALISLGNALLHLGIIQEPWNESDEAFQDLIDWAGANHGSAIQENLDEICERFQRPACWPKLTVDKYTALEISKELVAKLLDKGLVVALPIWDEKIGLHSVLVVGHEPGPGGESFTVVNRKPFTDEVVGSYIWEDLGYRRWNVPVRVYGRDPK